MKAKILLRRGTATEWAQKNPVLGIGEPGMETDTNRFKVGNGKSPWNALPYEVGDSTGSVSPPIFFSNSNGVSFGSNGSVVTASVQTNYQSPGAYLTTAMQSGAATISNVAVSVPGSSVLASAFVFSNNGNVTFGLNGSTISASAPAAGAGGSVNVSAGTTSNNLSAITFSNSNGVTFGLNASTLTASVKTDYQTSGAYLTTAMASNRASDFVQATAAFAGTNASGTIASGGISVSVAAPGAANINISAGTTSTNASAFTFSNSNGISFGLGTGASAGVITGTVATNYQSQGAYLTTAALSQDSSKYAGTNSGATNCSVTVNTSGVSVSLPNYLTTAMQSQSSSVFAKTGFTSTTTAGTAVVATHDTNGLSMGVPAFITTAMLSNAATISNINISAGTTSTNASAFTFSNSNGISFGLGTGASAGRVTATVQTDYLTNDKVVTLGVSNLGNTSGTTGLISGNVEVVFIGGNNVTLSQSQNVPNGGGTLSITFSVGNYITTQSNQAFSAGGGSSGFQTLSFSNANGVSFTNTGGQVAGSISAIKAFGASNTGNTAGNTGVSTGIDWVIAGTNNITVSESTVAGGPNTLWLSAPNVAAGNVTISAGAASAGLASLVFSNSNGVSFGLNGSTITASAAGGAGGIAAGVSTDGNTAGNTSTFSTGTLVFAGSNSLTISVATGAGSLHTIHFQPAVSNLTGVSGISLSSNGSTISIQPTPLLEFQPFPGANMLTNSTLGQSSLYFVPFDVQWPIAGSRINLFVSIAQTFSGAPPANNTAWIAMGYGLYTRMTGSDSNTMSLATSYSLSVAIGSVSSSTRLSMTHYLKLSNVTSHSTSQYAQNNATAPNYVSSSIAGYRAIALPLNSTLTPGRYWLGVSNQTASQGGSWILQMSVMQLQFSNFIAFRPFGTSSAASNASFYVPMVGLGSYSAQSAGWPASIALTTDAIRGGTSPIAPFFNISGIDYNTSVI